MIAPRAEGTHWYRLHLKQALWFGNAAALAALVALAWPLIVSLFMNSTAAVIWIYALAMLVDLVLLIGWLFFALRYSRRAARGEFFQIPWLARFTGTRPKLP